MKNLFNKQLVTGVIFAFSLNQFLNAQKVDSVYLSYLSNFEKVQPKVYNLKSHSNSLKTDFIELLDGNVPIIFEHHFSETISLESGIGLLLPYSLNNITSKLDIELLNRNSQFTNSSLGYSIYFGGKFYLPKNLLYISQPKSSFIILNYNLLKYDFLKIKQFGVGYGYRLDIKKISLQPTIALIYAKESEYRNITDIKYLRTASKIDINNDKTISLYKLNFGIQLGYLFSSK